MSMPTVPTCDICSKPKGETNHWFVAFRKMTVKGLGTCRTVIFDWTTKLAQQKNAIHICGEGCVSIFLSRDMADRTTEDEVKEKV
jgi:hypothetical protein